MRIAIGSDHAGFRYKERLVALLGAWGHEVADFGTHSAEPTHGRFGRFAIFVVRIA